MTEIKIPMFEGPWKVIDKDSLQQKTPGPGEIIRHRSGAIVLRCPKCRALQFTHSPIEGTDEMPTLTKSVQCGGGKCLRCGVWFRVNAGRTVITAAPAVSKTPVPK